MGERRTAGGSGKRRHVAVWVALLTAGCASGGGAAIESSLNRLERDLATLGKADTELRIRVDALAASVEKLNGRLRESEDRVTVLVDKVAEISSRPAAAAPAASSAPAVAVEEFGPAPETESPAQPAAPVPTPAGSPTYASPDELYQRAYAAYTNGDYSGAVLLFEEFSARFPQNAYVDNARYWVGESYYSMHDYRNAIDHFERVLRDHPTGTKAADAALKIGFAYNELQEFERATAELQRVVEQYPSSAAAEKARQKLAAFEAER